MKPVQRIPSRAAATTTKPTTMASAENIPNLRPRTIANGSHATRERVQST